jgi:predicted O-methyltransferase YrrM
MAELQSGKLKTILKGISRKLVSAQLRNIRRSCHLKTGWSSKAQASLVLRLSQKRAVDRRVLAGDVGTRRVRKTSLKKRRGSIWHPTGADSKDVSALWAGLDKSLRSIDCAPREGHVGSDQNKSSVIRTLCSSHAQKLHLIGQTGFNAGHSTILMLATSAAQVVTFTVPNGTGTRAEKTRVLGTRFVNQLFLGRHTMVLGDSQITVEKFGETHKVVGRMWDMVFVDGGHSYKCAISDLRSFHRQARRNCIVVIDDVVLRGKAPLRQWQRGPTEAWKEAVREGLILQQGFSATLAWGMYKV